MASLQETPGGRARSPGRVYAAAMLAVLITGFGLSQVYRTLPAVLGTDLTREFALTGQDLGVFAGAFHISFALLQMPLGVALDRFGPRRTVSVLSVLACGGAFLSALAPSFGTLVAGQLLIGAGCSGALMGALMFAARWYPPSRFAGVSGAILSLGGLGMLISATPMAWVIQSFGWRTAFALLGALSVIATVACALVVRDAPRGAPSVPAASDSLGAAMRGVVEVLLQRPTAGILLLALVTYPVTIAFRGVWIGPYLGEQFGFDTIAIGEAAIGVSLGMIVGPILFGRLDPGDRWRRHVLGIAITLSALLLLGLAVAGGRSFVIDYGMMLLFSIISSCNVLQFADVRRVYPDHLTGRALAILNMATFIGVALIQWLTGIAADLAGRWGIEPSAAALGTLGTALLLGLCAFVVLPGGAVGRAR